MMRQSVSTSLTSLLLVGSLALFSPPALGDPGQEVIEVARGNTSFAIDLFGQLRTTKDNLFFSPYSVSSALAMTYAGARGATAKEMAKVLHFGSDEAKLHQAMGALMVDLNERKLTSRWRGDPNAGKKPFELVVANSLWGQRGHPFHKEFVELVEQRYGGGFWEQDIEGQTEKARQTINS